MKLPTTCSRCAAGRRCALTTAGLILLALCAPATAYPPREPIPIPFFSLDLQSPSVFTQPPNNDVTADAILATGDPSDPQAVVIAPGINLGLGLPGDDLDAFSFNRGWSVRNREFVLLFSVNRATTGDIPPDPVLVADHVVFNVADQALRRQAAGDGFISLVAFDSNGPTAGTRGSGSNTQTVNNYDEGGQDYKALPMGSSSTYFPPGTAQDNVDGTAYGESNAPQRGARGTAGNGLYFTVTAESPSLAGGQLPGNSGADIFFDPQPGVPGLQQMFPYAESFRLGLLFNDDIDGLVIDDNNSNGVFDGDDCVYFSLTPDSPSVQLLPFASTNGAADVLVVCHNVAGQPVIELFAPAAELGLLGLSDDIDALEIIPCDAPGAACDPIMFARDAGIRLFPGDWNNDGVISLADTVAVPFCLSGPREGDGFLPPPRICQDIFDFNADLDVDLADFGFLQFIFDSSPADSRDARAKSPTN